MHALLNFIKNLSKIFRKKNSGVKLPISVNAVNDIKKSYTSPRSYY
jgi:hypothetical protein